MKFIRKLFFLALLFSGSVKAQSWAAPGATWYYDYTYFTWHGYERIQKTGDTIINNHQYDKLEIFRRAYDITSGNTNSYVSSIEFTRIDSNIVYYYRDSADYVLYNFNAQPGDQWTLFGDPLSNWPGCDTSSVKTDSISTTIINGDTLKVLYTSPVNLSLPPISFPDPVIEKIGCLTNLFPFIQCIVDYPQGYNFRCYSDSSGWFYTRPNFSQSCDNMPGMPEHSAFSFSLFLSPVPASDQLHYEISNPNFRKATMKISAADGRVLRNITILSPEGFLNCSGFAPGIYVAEIQTENGIAISRFIIR